MVEDLARIFHAGSGLPGDCSAIKDRHNPDIAAVAGNKRRKRRSSGGRCMRTMKLKHDIARRIGRLDLYVMPSRSREVIAKKICFLLQKIPGCGNGCLRGPGDMLTIDLTQMKRSLLLG